MAGFREEAVRLLWELGLLWVCCWCLRAAITEETAKLMASNNRNFISRGPGGLQSSNRVSAGLASPEFSRGGPFLAPSSFGSPGHPLPLARDALCASLSSCGISLSERISHWIRAYPDDPIVTWLHLQRPYFQIGHFHIYIHRGQDFNILIALGRIVHQIRHLNSPLTRCFRESCPWKFDEPQFLNL